LESFQRQQVRVPCHHRPENLFDGQLFNSLYQGINLTDNNATERIRTQSKERIISYLKDALWVTTIISTTSKEELIRCSHSLNFLEYETQETQ
jgi:hypothetical protein